MNRENRHKVTAFLAVLMFTALAIMAIPFVPDGTMTAKADLSETSGLTLAHSWGCGAAPTDAAITISTSTYNASAGQLTTYEYKNDGNRSYVTIHLKNTNTASENEYFTVSLGSSPGVQTVEGEIYVPEQHGAFTNSDDPALQIVLGGGASMRVVFIESPGAPDQFVLYNGTTGSAITYDIPRIPRDTWVRFVYSADVSDSFLKAFIWFSTDTFNLTYNKKMPAGPATLGYFNLRVYSVSYKHDTTIRLDNLKWYNEYFTLSDNVPTINTNNVYYKGWDWKDYIWIADRTYDPKIVYNTTVSDIDPTKPYYTIVKYAKNFTIKNVMIQTRTEDPDLYINESLKNSNYDKMLFWIQGNGSTINNYAKTLSWCKAYSQYKDKIIGLLIDDFSTHYTYVDANLTDIKTNLNKYSSVPVFGLIYTDAISSMAPSLYDYLDGAVVSGWYMGDYANINATIDLVRGHMGAKPLYLFLYTHEYHGSEPVKIPVLRELFIETKELIDNEEIEGVGILGPARFNNYVDHYDVHKWFSKEMALSYSSDGTDITVSKEEDGTYVSIDTLDVPSLNATTDKLTITSENWNVRLEVEIPFAWSYDNIVVRDTNGTAVNWTKGSVIFNATSGHTYEIYLKQTSSGFWLFESASKLTWYHWVWIILAVIFIAGLAIIYVSPKWNILGPKYKEVTVPEHKRVVNGKEITIPAHTRKVRVK